MRELSTILSELTSAVARVPSAELCKLAQRLSATPRVFVAGAGRTGLMTRALAMRLMHLDRTVYAAGETITPAIIPADLLLAASGSGRTVSVVEMARRAKIVGAEVFAITSEGDSPLAELADHRLILPRGPTPDRPSSQFANSLFEQTLLVTLDAVVLHLQYDLHKSPHEMQARHANLE